MRYRGALKKNIYMLQASTGQVDVSYIAVLLRTLLHVGLIPINHKRTSTYQLQGSANEQSSICTCH
jgi:hypothetical protein